MKMALISKGSFICYWWGLNIKTLHNAQVALGPRLDADISSSENFAYFGYKDDKLHVGLF